MSSIPGCISLWRMSMQISRTPGQNELGSWLVSSRTSYPKAAVVRVIEEETERKPGTVELLESLEIVDRTGDGECQYQHIKSRIKTRRTQGYKEHYNGAALRKLDEGNDGPWIITLKIGWSSYESDVPKNISDACHTDIFNEAQLHQSLSSSWPFAGQVSVSSTAYTNERHQ
ncbi:hypothetical protein BDZ45DRAFT_742930 [Acephala macrosclerotiorum]|nr:hypothetical protein BDZ45DRAFT_742930 [Acephala macrosclerotiorum]